MTRIEVELSDKNEFIVWGLGTPVYLSSVNAEELHFQLGAALQDYYLSKDEESGFVNSDNWGPA